KPLSSLAFQSSPASTLTSTVDRGNVTTVDRCKQFSARLEERQGPGFRQVLARSLRKTRQRKRRYATNFTSGNRSSALRTESILAGLRIFSKFAAIGTGYCSSTLSFLVDDGAHRHRRFITSQPHRYACSSSPGNSRSDSFFEHAGHVGAGRWSQLLHVAS